MDEQQQPPEQQQPEQPPPTGTPLHALRQAAEAVVCDDTSGERLPFDLDGQRYVAWRDAAGCLCIENRGVC